MIFIAERAAKPTIFEQRRHIQHAGYQFIEYFDIIDECWLLFYSILALQYLPTMREMRALEGFHILIDVGIESFGIYMVYYFFQKRRARDELSRSASRNAATPRDAKPE